VEEAVLNSKCDFIPEYLPALYGITSFSLYMCECLKVYGPKHRKWKPDPAKKAECMPSRRRLLYLTQKYMIEI
jgi:hypothetical protein